MSFWHRRLKPLLGLTLGLALALPPASAAANSAIPSASRFPSAAVSFQESALVPGLEAAAGYALPEAISQDARLQRAAAWTSGQAAGRHHGFGISMLETSADLEERIRRRKTGLEIDAETDGKIEGFATEKVLIGGNPVTLFVHPIARERLHRRGDRSGDAQKFIDLAMHIRDIHGDLRFLGGRVYQNLHRGADGNKYLIIDWLEEAPTLYGNCSQDSYLYIHQRAPEWMDAIGASHELEHIAGAGESDDQEEQLARTDRILIEAIGGLQQLRDALGEAVSAETSLVFRSMRLERSEAGLTFGPGILYEQYDPSYEGTNPNFISYLLDETLIGQSQWRRFRDSYERVFRALVTSDVGSAREVKDIMNTLTDVYRWWKDGVEADPFGRWEEMRLGRASDMSRKIGRALEKLESSDAVAAGIVVAVLLPEAMTPMAWGSELQLSEWCLSEYSAKFRAAAEEETKNRDDAHLRPVTNYFDPWVIHTLYRQRDERPKAFIERSQDASTRRGMLGILRESAEFRYLVWRRRAERNPGEVRVDDLSSRTLDWAIAAFHRGNQSLFGSPQMQEAYDEAERYFRILLMYGDLEDIALENLYRLDQNRASILYSRNDAEDLPERKENPYLRYLETLPAAYYRPESDPDLMPPLDLPREQVPLARALSPLDDMSERDAFPAFEKLTGIFAAMGEPGKFDDHVSIAMQTLGQVENYRDKYGDLRPSPLLTQAMNILLQISDLPFPGAREAAHNSIMRLQKAGIQVRGNIRGMPFERPQTYAITINPVAHEFPRPPDTKTFPHAAA